MQHTAPTSRAFRRIAGETPWTLRQHAAGSPWAALRPTLPAWLTDSQGDRLFIEMLQAFRPSGGLAREAELLPRYGIPAGAWAPGWHEALGSESPIRFDWGDDVWLPLFQFKPGERALHPAAAAVLAELSPHYDGWTLANWFAQPNTWLGDQRPVDLLNPQAARVLEAARVDRFIVAG